MDLGERECCSVDWIDLAQDMDKYRIGVNASVNLRAAYKAGK
jgi:hypothetical protein